MTESPLNLSDLKAALKRKSLRYKFQKLDFDGNFGEIVTFIDLHNGIQVCGKVIRSFTEGEVYHWPILSHENLAPLIDVVNINDKLNVFITIDQEIKLKDIIHDEDFVYNPECFERKKRYAKGIFSGLSYLHSRSLALMNLSDSNIVICKITDKAILTNFSDLMCSRRCTCKLRVPKLYRAPESENGDFDLIAAEIWAAGTLMLDMFLAHMVPWAIIDYKPNRVMEMVDKLSSELLQAANVGSYLSFIDLTKFKTFLKCFFKAKPMTRITAEHASYASFLSPKVYDYTKGIDILQNPRYKYPKYVYEDYHSSNCSQLPNFSHEATVKQAVSVLPSKSLDSILATPKPITTNTNEDDYEDINLSVLDIRSALNSRERNNYKTMSAEKAVPLQDSNDSLNKQPMNSVYTNNLPLRHSDNSENFSTSRTATENSDMYKSTESCKTIKQITGTRANVNYTCQQSKSLSFLKSKYCENMNNPVPLNNRPTKSYSNANSKSFSDRQLSMVHLQSSNFSLDRLFNEDEPNLHPDRLFNDAKMTEETEKASKTSDIAKTNENDDLPKIIQAQGCINENNLSLEEFKVNTTGVQNLHTTHSLDVTDIHDIVNNITLLKQCQDSLKSHPRIQTSDEFPEKQERILREYQILLHHEKLKLFNTLKIKYALSTAEIMRLIGTNVNQNRRDYHYSRTCDSRLIIRKTNKDDGQQQIRYDNNVKPTVRLRRQYSYYRAVKASINQDKRECEGAKKTTDLMHLVPPKQNELADKLVEKNKITGRKTDDEDKKKCRKKETKNSRKATRNQNKELKNRGKQATSSKDKEDSKKSNKAKSKTERSTKVTELPTNHKVVKPPRRPYFFSLCPGGKVEDLPTYCETCKLQLEDV